MALGNILNKILHNQIIEKCFKNDFLKQGGATQLMTHLSEFLPSKWRALILILSNLIWSLGSAIQMTLAIFVVPNWGWRWYMVVCTLPLLVFLSFAYWLPESARFYMACGRRDMALNILKRISYDNKIELPEGELCFTKVRKRFRIDLKF